MLTYKSDKEKYYQQTLDDEIKLNELYQTLQEIKARIPQNYKIYQWYEDVMQLIKEAESEG